jgi:S-adenosylmethionine-dependent methyltransferase
VKLKEIVPADARTIRTPPFSREPQCETVLLPGPLHQPLEEPARICVLEDRAVMLQAGGVLVRAAVTRVAHLRDLMGWDPSWKVG